MVREVCSCEIRMNGVVVLVSCILSILRGLILCMVCVYELMLCRLGMSLLVLIVVLVVRCFSEFELGVSVVLVSLLVCVVVDVVEVRIGCVVIDCFSVSGCVLFVCLKVISLGSGLFGSGVSLVFISGW